MAGTDPDRVHGSATGAFVRCHASSMFDGTERQWLAVAKDVGCSCFYCTHHGVPSLAWEQHAQSAVLQKTPKEVTSKLDLQLAGAQAYNAAQAILHTGAPTDAQRSTIKL